MHGKFSLIFHHKGGCKCGCQQLACDPSYKQRQKLRSHSAGWGEGGRLLVSFPRPSVHLVFQVTHLPKHVAFLRTLTLKETLNTVIVRTWREINIFSIFHFWEQRTQDSSWLSAFVSQDLKSYRWVPLLHLYSVGPIAMIWLKKYWIHVQYTY